MQLILMTSLMNTGTLWKVYYTYLFAVDSGRRAYLLPVGNIHSDGQVCTGDFKRNAPTMVDMFNQVLQQFWDSKWNSDLYHDDPDSTLNLIRFKTKNDGFEQLNHVGEWADHCDKVATEISNGPLMEVVDECI